MDRPTSVRGAKRVQDPNDRRRVIVEPVRGRVVAAERLCGRRPTV
jgi:hypothetical protein